jgi:hypothetical protein
VLVGRRLGPEPGETGDPAATGWPRGVELRRCQQKRCAALVQLCRPSDRGHRCCSKACSTAERARCLRSARRRHRRSPERQADHREAERARSRAGDHGSLVFLEQSHPALDVAMHNGATGNAPSVAAGEGGWMHAALPDQPGAGLVTAACALPTAVAACVFERPAAGRRARWGWLG